MNHCGRRGCEICARYGLAEPGSRALSGEPSAALAGPGFAYCPECGHAVSEGRSCLYCQVQAGRSGGCCAACDARDQETTGWQEAMDQVRQWAMDGDYAP
jgi:ribosomal protein L32